MIEFVDNCKDKNIKDIILKNDDKKLKIFYGMNSDLYFDISEKEQENTEKTGKEIDFLIKNEDEAWIYFNRMFNRIINDEKNNQRAKLFKDNIITWYSDEIYDERANRLKIEKLEEGIKLSFLNNEEDPSKGFEIRISNGASKYFPFNMYFMHMYSDIQELAKIKEKQNDQEER